MNEMKLSVPQEDAGKRIDSWLSEHIDGLTRSAVQNLLSEQAVNADGKAVKKNYKLAGGEVLTVPPQSAQGTSCPVLSASAFLKVRNRLQA